MHKLKQASTFALGALLAVMVFGLITTRDSSGNQSQASGNTSAELNTPTIINSQAEAPNIILPSHDHAGVDDDHADVQHLDELRQQSSGSNYTIPEWGITLRDVNVVDSVFDPVRDSALLRTFVYVELERTAPISPEQFNQCFSDLINLRRIAESNVTDDLNAKPWWTVRAELDFAAVKSGGYYYYFLGPQSSTCPADSQLIEDALVLLSIDAKQILEGIN